MPKIEHARLSDRVTEVRRFASTELRMSSDGSTLQGIAARYDQESRDLGYSESIAPGAFTRTIKDNDEVLALVEHDQSKLLGRRSAGTLRLSESSEGLEFSIDVPQTTLGNDTREQIKRGDLQAMSFAFSLDSSEDEVWTRSSTGRRERRLLNLRLHDISIVSSPAYERTALAVRSTRSLEPMAETKNIEGTFSAVMQSADEPESEAPAEAEAPMDEARRLTRSMRSILDGDMDSQQAEKYDRMELRLAECETEIRSAGRADALARADALLNEPTRRAPGHSTRKGSSVYETRAYNDAFHAMIAGSATTEQRDMLAGSGTGTNIVPTELEAEILKLIDAPWTMRSLCTVTQARGNREIPIEDAIGVGAWVGEQGPLTTSDITLSQKTASPKSFGTGIAWSSLMEAQSIVNVNAYFGMVVGRTMSDGLENGYVNGLGSSFEPEGLLPALGTPTAIDLATNKGDAIIDATQQLSSQYRTGACWLMPDSVLSQIRKLKDSQGSYLFKNSERYSDLRDGTPGMLYGYPIKIVEAMPATTLVFGNVGRAYRIFDWGPSTMLLDPYTNAATMSKVLWAYRATDGVLVDEHSAASFVTTA
jgi:hypothetical protein